MRVNVRILSLIAILLIASTALVFANDSKVSVIINNQPVTYSNETGYPFLDSKGRTQVPFRQTMTAFGCTVDWNKETQTAIAMKDGIKVEVPIGKAYILKDGVNVSNDTTAVIINGKTYLPIAIVLRSFGAEVEWDNGSKAVVVSSLISEQVDKTKVKDNKHTTVLQSAITIDGEQYVDINIVNENYSPTFTISWLKKQNN